MLEAINILQGAMKFVAGLINNDCCEHDRCETQIIL